MLSEDGKWQIVQHVEVKDEPLSAYNLTVDNDHTYFIAGNYKVRGVWVHNDCLYGVAKDAKWVSPIQGVKGPGLRDHFGKHGEEVGAKTAKDYDLSARVTIKDGTKFTYRDPSSNQPRVGYYNSQTGLFTATSETRKTTAILSHYPLSIDKIKKLPGFSWSR